MSLVSRAKSLPALIAVALAAPMFGARAWSTAYADRLAVAVAARISDAVPRVNPQPSDEPPEASDEREPAAFAASSSAARERTAGKGRVPVPVRVGNVAHGIRISAAQVLALAARRAMPPAVPVKATADHPAGLMLRSVSALGVGLQDGDVLTEAAGQKAASVATVV